MSRQNIPTNLSLTKTSLVKISPYKNIPSKKYGWWAVLSITREPGKKSGAFFQAGQQSLRRQGQAYNSLVKLTYKFLVRLFDFKGTGCPQVHSETTFPPTYIFSGTKCSETKFSENNFELRGTECPDKIIFTNIRFYGDTLILVSQNGQSIELLLCHPLI